MYGLIMHLQLGEISFVVISSAETAREVLKTHDLSFASRPISATVRVLSYGVRDMMFAPYGDYCRQIRRVCVVGLLSPKRVGCFQSVIEAEVFNLIRSIATEIENSSGTVTINLSDKLAELANSIITRAVIGSGRREEQATFLAALREAIEITSGFTLAELFPSAASILGFVYGTSRRLQKVHGVVDRMLEEIIREHREARKRKSRAEDYGEEDLVDVLLRIEEDGELVQFSFESRNIKAVIFDMLSAGSDTTASTLEWALSELVQNPAAMRQAQSEVREVLQGGGSESVAETASRQLSYLPQVIKETLRLHPPGPLLLPRECRSACEVLGHRIPATATVVVNAWAIGRDPRYWGDDADEFKPERFSGIRSSVDLKGSSGFEYLPFGGERRICPGMHFGLASVELALA